MPRLLFEKTGDSVWISHLDLMRVFQRAFRRAGLLLKHSQGFTPRAIVSIALPLSVGVESQCELLDYELESPAEVTPELLNAKLPAGVHVLEVLDTGRKIKELTHLRACVTIEYDNGVPDLAVERIKQLFKQESLILEKHSRKGKSETNIVPMICQMDVEQRDEGTVILHALVCAQNPSLNPQLLVTALQVYAPELTPDYAVVRRVEVYDSEGKVFR